MRGHQLTPFVYQKQLELTGKQKTLITFCSPTCLVAGCGPARRHNMSLVDSYALSLQLWQAHTMYADGSVDCNHWCAPGLSEVRHSHTHQAHSSCGWPWAQ